MAQIDPSIALGVRPIQIRDPLEAYGNALQVQGLQQANALRGEQLGRTQRLNALNLAGMTPEQQEQALLGGGFFKEAGEVGKINRENKKLDAETAHSRAQTSKLTQETDFAKADRLASMLRGADERTWGAVRAYAIETAHPEDRDKVAAAIPEQFDPVIRDTMVQRTISAVQAMQDKRAQQQQAEAARHNRATEGLTARGQNMTDARARDAQAQTMTKPFEVTGPDGQPMLVQQDKQGNIKPVEGFGPKAGSAKPLTDAQAKALGFGSRMQESDKVISDLETKGVMTPSLIKQGAQAVPLIGGALGMGANFIASPEQQMVEQAQRDFLNAVLRRESGAVISDQEFASGRLQYFPQPGDDKKNREQKARNRELAIKGVLAEVPEGQRSSLSKPKAAAAVPPPAAGPSTDLHQQAEAIIRGGR